MSFIPILKPKGRGSYSFSPSGTVTFTAGMAKRATSVFAAAPILQGTMGYIVVRGDTISITSANVVDEYFRNTFDLHQGSICFRIIPEWNGNDGLNHYILTAISGDYPSIYKSYANTLVFFNYITSTSIDVSGWVAGTTYNVCMRWDTKNTLDGTNYFCFSINDTHTFTSGFGSPIYNNGGTLLFGNCIGAYDKSANAIIEGFTIYRRVLYDGAYGVNVGNGDEVNLISAGVDPTTVTGSWDVLFCLPTNASAGTLATGTGSAWSHPHSSNLLTRGFLSDRYYGGTNQWGVAFNGTSTAIDCGSGATLDDLPNGAVLQVEGWFRHSGTTTQVMVSKGGVSTATGWNLYVDATGYPIMLVDLATTNATATHTTTIEDGKWHHVVGTYDDSTRVARVAVDGVWGTAGSAGTGAYVTDAALNLSIGKATSGTAYYWTGSMGWINIHNDAHYTPGTNFVPVRTAPAADLEMWHLDEGTGATITAEVTAPANNGTLSNGTWEQQWHDEATPVMLQSITGSANYQVDVGSGATIDDLADNAFTVDGWYRIKGATVQVLSTKGTYTSTGWVFRISAAGKLEGIVCCATTNAYSLSTASYNDGYWHYFKMTYDDAGDRKIDLFVDNVECTYTTETAGNGAIVSDAAQNGYITNSYPILSTSAHGWVRWSDVVRGAGMICRSNPPATDGDTMAQWNVTDGAGATLTDAVGPGTNNGTASGTYTWNNTPAMEVDSPTARTYKWGYVFGADHAHDGVHQVYAVTAGNDYSVTVEAYSEDGVGQPEVVVYDETGAAAIATVLGTTTSTERVPDRLHFTFEAPAGCASISVKLLNATATGVVGFSQIILSTNLWDDPSVETGTAVTDVGTPSTSAQSNEQAHSDTNSWKIVTDADGEGFQRDVTVTSGKFYNIAAWVYDATAGKTVTMTVTHGTLQASSTANTVSTTTVGSWTRLKGIFRADAAQIHVGFTAGSGTTFYVDDVVVMTEDDVSLTCTAATVANSAESSGIRVDGHDILSQTISGGLTSTHGRVRFRYIPRHSAADVIKFGAVYPMICDIYGDGDNYIEVYWSAANTVTLYVKCAGAATSTNWDATGAIVAGTSYLIEVSYDASNTYLKVDGTTVATNVAATGFAVVPTTFYAGADQSDMYQADAVYLAP